LRFGGGREGVSFKPLLQGAVAETVLGSGPLPLSVLDRVVSDWVTHQSE
jgi:hypothetical protein